MRDMSKNIPSIEQLPFIKRKQYEDESEFRLIYKNRNKELKLKYIPFDLSSINRITLSPWLPLSISKTIKQFIWDIEGCENIEIIRTGVVDNRKWKNIANKLA